MAKGDEAPALPLPTHLGLHAALVLISLTLLYPVFWVVSLALSGQQSVALNTTPADAPFVERLVAVLPIPPRLSFDNFIGVLVEQPFLTWMWNSLVIAGLTTFVGVALACTAGYALSRFRFPGRNAGMMIFLVTQMFPGTLMLVPLYIILVEWMNLGDGVIGLVLVYAVTAIPFCVWMLKGYFDSIPFEIEESALMDGASPARIFISIILPLARPAIAVTALFSFMTAWNEFILAATFIESETRYTAPIGLRFFVSEYTSQWGYFAAGSIMVSAPVVVLFLVLQRFLVSGLTAGGVKG